MMKNSCIIIVCILALFGNINAANIKGKTSFNNEYSLHIEYIQESKELSVIIPINSDGTFSKDLDLNSNSIVYWSFYKNDGGRQLPVGGYFYLLKDENIEFDYFMGKGSKEKPLNLEFKMKGNVSEANKLFADYYKCNYISKINRNTNDIKTESELLNKYRRIDDSVKEFLHFQFVSNELGYGKYGMLSEEKRSEILKVFNSDIANKISMNRYWRVLVYTLYVNGRTPLTISQLGSSLKLLNNEFKNREIVDKLAKTIMEAFNSKYKLTGDFNSALSEMEKAVSNLDDKKTRKYLIDTFKLIIYTKEGASMPDVTFVDAKGQPAKLSDFKGKYTYIDLWFVGCHWCYEEVPFLAALEKEFPEVNFISVCKTRNDIAWKKQMKKSNMHGVQLRENAKPYFTEIMQVHSYPTFMLYSPDGKLVNSKAPRYRESERIRAYLKKILKK